MSPMSRRLEISGCSLITCVKSYIAGCKLEEIQHPHQAQDLTKKKTAATGRGQGLPLVNFHCIFMLR